MNSARHVIEHIVNPRFLITTVSYDVAIHQALIVFATSSNTF